MSRVSYFQRFSQKENHATNNTLLVLRHFYQAEPGKLERALNSLLEGDLSIGLTFDQQVRAVGSVPDALISQPAFQIFIETKRGGALERDQIERHIAGINHRSSGGTNVLLGLTKTPLNVVERSELTALAKEAKVLFAAVTFSDVASALRDQCAAYETELDAVLTDFEAYLDEADLSDDDNRWLPILPCGLSLAENLKFGLYYEPPSRPLKTSRFLGLYANKAVRYVGEVKGIAICSWVEGKLRADTTLGHVGPDELQRIQAMADGTPYYQLKDEVERFYVTDGFVETSVAKITPGGIMGPRYLDLFDVTNGSFDRRTIYSLEELAKLLSKCTFK